MDSSKILPNLDDFVEQGKITSGGYANVYKVVNVKEPNILLAAKESSTEFTGVDDDPSLKKFITREVNILAQLNFPSVLKFIACCPYNFHDDPYPVIITEYCKNGTLHSFINLERNKRSHQKWNYTKKLINIYGIAKGMSYLHSNNVIHRDLKPENVFEDDSLFPKIADFGTSKLLNYNFEDKFFKSDFGGSPSFLPPEFIKDHEFDKKGDVYSFAFIVYQIVTLCVPYKGLKELQIYGKVVKNERPAFPKNTPKCYVDLITRCWQQDPKMRPTFDEIVEMLRTDKQFIDQKANEDEFYDYVNLLDIDGKSVDITKQFQKVTVSQNGLGDQIKRKSIHSAVFDEINQLEIYKKVPNSVQRFIKDKLALDSHALYLTYKDTNFLFLNKCFESKDFMSILYSWSSVTIELKQQGEYFQTEFDIISKLIDQKAQRISFHLILSDPSNINDLIRYIKVPISVTIESSLSSIEPNTFLNCFSVTRIELPSSVTKIGKKCFDSCTKLEEVVFPDTVTEIDSSAFRKCLSLHKVKIPLLKEISPFTFIQCANLKEVEIPPSVTVIGSNAFNNCTSLEKVELNSNVTNIGDFAFNKCTSLRQITIPPKLKVLKNSVFLGCSSLTDVTIPKSVEIIESYVFNSCTNLKEIKFELPSSLSAIHIGAFGVCPSLEEVNIPPSVKSIEFFAFCGCSSLKKFTFSHLNVIDESTFNNCISLEKITIHSPTSEIRKYAFEKCKKLRNVTIPFSVESIGDKAFNLCSSLLSVTIPSSVKSIGSFAFSNCSALNELVVPSSVCEIGVYAFRGCISLKKLSFSPSIRKIENSLFEGCTALESVEVPPSVTEIGIKAFQSCSMMKKVDLPPSLIRIDSFAFFGCSSLEKLKIPPNVREIGEKAFDECPLLVKSKMPFGFQIHDLLQKYWH